MMNASIAAAVAVVLIGCGNPSQPARTRDQAESPPAAIVVETPQRVADMQFVSAAPLPSETFTRMSRGPSPCAVTKSGDVWCGQRGVWSASGWKVGGPAKRLVATRGRTCALLETGSIECSSGAALSAGPYIDVALADDGTVCWIDKAGKLGCRAEDPRLASPPAGDGFTAIDCADVCCALGPGGRAACWGSEKHAVLPPVAVLHSISVQNAAACGLDESKAAVCWSAYNPRAKPGPFESLVVGTTFACGFGATGRPDCWSLYTPDEIGVPPIRIAAIALGMNDDGCALDTEGRLACWTQNVFGPVPRGRFRAISGGRDTICALRESGEPVCWGWSGAMLAHVPTTPFATLDVGDFQACGISAQGRLSCWGSTFDGALDHPAGTFKAVGAGNLACALDLAGEARCWAGHGATLPGRFTALAGGSAYTCGLRVDGTVACAAGDKFLADRTDATPPAGKRFASLYGGYEHICGLDADGVASCWGRDVDGETRPPLGKFRTLALGEKRSCGIAFDGSARCWGGTSSTRAGPFRDIAITGNTDLESPAYVCAIRASDASVECWIYGNDPQR